MSSSTTPPVLMPVETVIDGESYTGCFTVNADVDMVTVFRIVGKKSTQVGGSPPASLAKLMLGEMVREDPERRK